MAALVASVGFALWFWAIQTYRLVLRDEDSLSRIFSVLAILALLFSLVVLWLLKKLAQSQKREVGWYWTHGGKSHRRGGPLRWEDVILPVVFGAVFGVPGFGLWLNCAFDRSEAHAYSTTVLKLRASSNNKGGQSFYWTLRDWKNPQRSVQLTISRAVFQSHKVGDTVVLTTKDGAFGYEWIVVYN